MPERKPYALIAEADPERASRYIALVTRLGLEPNHARDGESARATLRTRGAPALVVTELSLPGLDGFRLLEELRSRATPEVTPALVVSGFVELRSRAWQERERLGISEVLSTSASPDELARAMRRALTAARTAQSPPASDEGTDTPRTDALKLTDIHAPGLLTGDTPDEALALLAEQLAVAFNVPLALVWLADRRAFVGARHTNDLPPAAEVGPLRDLVLPRSDEDESRPQLVPDLAVDVRRMLHPLVKRGVVRSLVTVPLTEPGGFVMGGLALLHRQRLMFAREHLDELGALARRLMGEVEVQSLRRRDDAPEQLEYVVDVPVEGVGQLQQILDALDEGVLLLDESRRVLFANRTLAEMLGRPLAAIIGQSFEVFVHDTANLFDDPGDWLARAYVAAEGPFVMREQLELSRPRRRVVRWMVKPVQLAGGIGQLSIVTDISAHIELERARERLARSDYLTGLANRTAAEEALAREMARARRDELPLSLCMVDVDGFRALNERAGSAHGDAVLKAVALAVEGSLRGGDLVARWGGDELLLVLPGVGEGGARVVGERVRTRVGGLGFEGVTVSVGTIEVALDQPPGVAIARCLGRLEFARSEGGNRVA